MGAVDRTFRILIFRAVFLGTLCSGLAALALSKIDEQRIDTVFFRFARRIMKGKAAVRTTNSDGSETVRTLTNRQVVLKLGVCQPSVYLQCERVKWLQTMFRKPELNKQLIAAMFGKYVFEYADVPCHPHFFQACKDIDSLCKAYDSGLFDEVDRCPVALLKSTYQLKDFLRLDPKILGAAQTSVAIPPPVGLKCTLLNPCLQESMFVLSSVSMARSAEILLTRIMPC